jgi:hypothetical protein
MSSFSGLVMLFAQAVLAVVFSASLLSKLRDPGRFRRTVVAFDIVPYSWSAAIARALTVAEGIALTVLILGIVRVGSWPPRWVSVAGLLLGLALIAIYTAALAVVKLRRARVACNCFGGRNATVSWYDVVRNALLLALAFAGLTQVPEVLSAPDRALVALAAAPVALIIINFADVAEVALSSGND